jgi:hypothetical protein
MEGHQMATDIRTNNTHEDLVDGYCRIVDERLRQGWEPWLLTFEFHPLPGCPASWPVYIQARLADFYSLALTRIIRRPMKEPLDRLPFMLGMPDLPVAKRAKIAPLPVINDGLHAHALYLVPPRTRLKGKADGVLLEDLDFFRAMCRLQTLDIRPVTYTPEKALLYIMKSLARRRFGSDEIWIFPRTHGEVRFRETMLKADTLQGSMGDPRHG